MNGEDALMRWVYTAMAAVAGAITSLSALQWKSMTWGEIFLTLFVGASFAIYVTPWLATMVFGQRADAQSIAALTYVTASGSNILLPALIRMVKRVAGLEEPKP